MRKIWFDLLDFKDWLLEHRYRWVTALVLVVGVAAYLKGKF